MIEVTSQPDIRRVRELFHTSPTQPPGSLRVYAILNGDTCGHVFVDDPTHPVWAAAHEIAYDRTLYFAGAPNAPVVQAVIAHARQGGDVVLCLWRDDSQLAQWLPPPDYDGEAIDFTQRAGNLQPLLRMPDGCDLRRIDAELLRRKGDYAATVAAYGSESAALTKGLGFCLMRGDEILCEAFTGPPVDGVIELGVETREAHRGRGYATVTCAHLVQMCERLGLTTFWNAPAQNAASIALARNLGYQREQPHRVLAWNKTMNF